MTEDIAIVRFAVDQSQVRLRELTGHDERSVGGAATRDALALLNRLIVNRDGKSIGAEDLVAADRDRLLVTIYQRAFGDRIQDTLTCTQCHNPFDIHFFLSDLVGSVQQPAQAGRIKMIGANLFESAEGVRFRLPRGRDEQRLAELPTDQAEAALLQCCQVQDSSSPSAVELQELLSDVAPLVDLELNALCPECSQSQSLHFDIQSYLLNALAGERQRLAFEIHRLALAYGWDLDEILLLTRSERRYFVELIENEAVRGRRIGT